MSTTQARPSRTVYRGHGESEQTFGSDDRALRYYTGVEDSTSLGTVMSRDVICARPDLDMATIVSLVIDRHLGCIPVIDEHGKPIGMITKFDLVEQLEATTTGTRLPAELRAETAEEVMMPIALTLGEHATIAHAATMMMTEDTHHILVVDGSGVLVGVVSAKDIVGWVVSVDLVRA